MTQLLKKNQQWSWNKEQQTAFEEVKTKLTTAPILQCPDFAQPFFLQTDASTKGLGVVLFQRHSDQERVVAYASRTLTAAEMNYTTTEQECLAILWGIRKMRPYLEGYHFTVITDHHSLKWLHSLQNPSGRLARWALEVQQYDFDIEYRKGSNNVVADALSRSPLPEPTATIFALNQPNNDNWVAHKMAQVETDPAKYPDFQIIDGRLFKPIGPRTRYSQIPEWKQCIPRHRQLDILHETHDTTAAGLTKTLRRAQISYYWPGMYRDIKRYVQACNKVEQRKPAGLMTTMQCTTPWEIVCADFVGPLPRSSKGNTCLLVLIDKFTKWVELVPVRQATSGSVINALKERVIYRFGCPKIVLTDNGRQFVSKEVGKFLQDHGIIHRTTAPYTPQENPTERTNRVVKTMISQWCEENHRQWDAHLPEIAFAINTAVPNYGRDPPPPCQVRREGRMPQESSQTIDMPKLWGKAAATAREATAKQAKYFNAKARQWQPEKGELVYKREHPLSNANKHFDQK